MYLGLDLGTSGLRGLLLDENGHPAGSAECGIATDTPHSGWSEQSPEDWIEACRTVIGQLRDAHPVAFSGLRGIGLSGHMHGATLLDRDGAVLRPCILWNDTRAAAQAQALDSEPKMRAISGNIVFPGFTAPKLNWVRDHEPEIYSRIAKVLLPKDYVRLWLTGEYISDMSDSAGTSWLDVGARGWSETALKLAHMRADQMPHLVEGSQPGGMLRKALQQEWGLSAPVVIAGGAGDNAAAACGIGCIQDGDGFLSLGTSGVVLVARDSYAPAPDTAVHCFCHSVPEMWIQMGVILSATNSLNWLSRTLGQPVAELVTTLPTELQGPAATTFLPYLSGERTPHNDSIIRAAFLGLDITTEPADLTRSVMEGVAFALRDCLEALGQTGTRPQGFTAVGGGAKSRYWLEILATVLGLPVSLPKDGELGAALGAARLAICAESDASPASVMARPDIATVVEPQEKLREAYEQAYQRYRNYYSALAPLATE